MARVPRSKKDFLPDSYGENEKSAFPSFHIKADYGMGLRDWFAGQALANAQGTPEIKAQQSYADADAMMTEREK